MSWQERFWGGGADYRYEIVVIDLQLFFLPGNLLFGGVMGRSDVDGVEFAVFSLFFSSFFVLFGGKHSTTPCLNKARYWERVQATMVCGDDGAWRKGRKSTHDVKWLYTQEGGRKEKAQTARRGEINYIRMTSARKTASDLTSNNSRGVTWIFLNLISNSNIYSILWPESELHLEIDVEFSNISFTFEIC